MRLLIELPFCPAGWPHGDDRKALAAQDIENHHDYFCGKYIQGLQAVVVCGDDDCGLEKIQFHSREVVSVLSNILCAFELVADNPHGFMYYV